MEQPCYKCGQLLEEGRPFCPHCGAPQIRVVVAETVAAAKPFAEVEGTVQGEAGLPASETVPVLAVPVRWSQAFKPCILAASVASLLMLLGLNALVGMLSAGFLAVVFYRGGRPGAVLKPGSGARLGIISGLLSFAISAFVVTLAAMVPDLRSRLQQQLIDNVQKVATSRPGDPRFQTLLEQLKTPEGFITVLLVAGVMLLIVSIVLASFSGAVTAVMLSRRERH
jgi:hypothetical protein